MGNKYWIMPLDDQNPYTTTIYPVSRIYVLFSLNTVNLQQNEKTLKNFFINLYKISDMKPVKNQITSVHMFSESDQQHNQTNETSSYETKTVQRNSRLINIVCKYKEKPKLNGLLNANMRKEIKEEDKTISKIWTTSNIRNKDKKIILAENKVFPSNKIPSIKEMEIITQSKLNYLRRSSLQLTHENVK